MSEMPSIKQAENFHTQGLEKDRQRNYEESIQYFEEAIRLYPDYVRAYLDLGSAKMGMNDIQGCIDEYEKARNVLIKQGRLDDAALVEYDIKTYKFALEHG